MTRNSALKKHVRARMVETGENYTTALRAVTGERRSPIAEALRPGTVTLAINAGGRLNAALFLPELARLAREGHQLLLAPLARPRSIDLPHLIDFLVAGEVVSLRQAQSLWDDFDALHLAATTARLDRSKRLNDSVPFSRLEQELQRASSETGKPPVVYVQDVQEAGAIHTAWPRNEALQVAELRGLARVTGAIVAAGHCMASEMRESWQSAADAATTTFAIEDDFSNDLVRQSRVDCYEVGDLVGAFEWMIDLGVFRWRDQLYNRESSTR